MSNPHLCSFCGRSEELVDKMISSPQAFICDKCVRLCSEIIEKQLPPRTDPVPFKILKPKEIKSHLDAYVIGQEMAKRTLSVAVYQHYKRIQSLEGEYDKSNVLLLGPTGSGKTLLARTLADLLDVPFALVDATTLTEAGYVGEDVENILLKLVQAADYDIKRAEQGIIYIDEVDKLRKTSGNVSITRDVSGEGVQQALLKIIEGTSASVPPKGGRKHPNQEYLQVNTANVLFIAGGSFVHLEKVIGKRLGEKHIGFQKMGSAIPEQLISQVTVGDLVAFGLIPEFAGRFSQIVSCNELSEEDLVHILTQPKNALLRQYVKFFADEGVELEVTKEALHALAAKAKKNGTGARALRSLLEGLLMQLMFEIPSSDSVRQVIVDEDGVETREPKVLYAS